MNRWIAAALKAALASALLSACDTQSSDDPQLTAPPVTPAQPQVAPVPESPAQPEFASTAHEARARYYWLPENLQSLTAEQAQPGAGAAPGPDNP